MTLLKYNRNIKIIRLIKGRKNFLSVILSYMVIELKKLLEREKFAAKIIIRDNRMLEAVIWLEGYEEFSGMYLLQVDPEIPE